MIKRIKSILSTNALTKIPYKYLARIKSFIRYYPKIHKKKKQLRSKGVITIKKIQEILEKSNCLFHFDMGTLLGIIREGKLLGHDLDIDIAVHVTSEEKINEIQKLMLNNNCIKKFRYKIANIGIVEDSYILNNIKIDINYYSYFDDKSICYLFYREEEKSYEENKFSVVRLSCSKIEKIIKIPFMGFNINVPQNPKGYLTERYGQNWRIPDKSYTYWKGPSAEKNDNVGERITY